MANRVNIAGTGGRATSVRHLPAHDYTPLLGEVDATRIAQIFSALPPLKYPINSAGELREKLGGLSATLTISGRSFKPAQLLTRLEAHYFPIASFENFAEKIAHVIRTKGAMTASTSSAKTAVKVAMPSRPSEIDRFRKDLAVLRFPIRNADELVHQLEGQGTYQFRGRQIHPRSVKALIPARLFPIESLDSFVGSIEKLIRARPQPAQAAAPAHTHPALPKHAVALATRTVFGATRAPGPKLHAQVAHEPGLASGIAHDEMQPAPGTKAVRLASRKR
jgi:hypothetical protein